MIDKTMKKTWSAGVGRFCVQIKEKKSYSHNVASARVSPKQTSIENPTLMLRDFSHAPCTLLECIHHMALQGLRLYPHTIQAQMAADEATYKSW